MGSQEPMWMPPAPSVSTPSHKTRYTSTTLLPLPSTSNHQLLDVIDPATDQPTEILTSRLGIRNILSSTVSVTWFSQRIHILRMTLDWTCKSAPRWFATGVTSTPPLSVLEMTFLRSRDHLTTRIGNPTTGSTSNTKLIKPQLAAFLCQSRAMVFTRDSSKSI